MVVDNIGLIKRLGRDERGTSAVEMGLICSMIVLAILGALQAFAAESNIMWDNIAKKTAEASNPPK